MRECSAFSPSRRDFLVRSTGTLLGGAAAPALLRAHNVKAAFVGPPVASGPYNLSNSAITPNLTAGDTYEITVSGPANTSIAMCQQINGGSWSCYSRGQTDSNGAAVFTGQAGIVGTYNQTWYVGSQQCTPNLQFRVYPWNTNISSSIMQNVTAAATAIYKTTKGIAGESASAFANAASPFQAFFTHMNNLGLTPTFVSAISKYYASNGIPAYNSSLQSGWATAAAAMGWSSPLVEDYFLLDAAIAPVLGQVQPLNSQTNWNNLMSTFGGCLSYYSWYVENYGFRVDPRASPFRLARYYRRRASAADAQQEAEVGAAAGGVMAVGGAGLVSASGITAGGLAAATLTEFTLFTGGVGLIVIGVGIAGYYGWQYLQSSGGGGASSGRGGGTPPPEVPADTLYQDPT